MPRYITFLRAINVGGHIVKMEYLETLFEELGFSNVETFIASGNVIFESSSKDTKALEQTIEKHLLEKLGYAVTTFIRTDLQVSEIASYKPFNEKLLRVVRPGTTVVAPKARSRSSERRLPVTDPMSTKGVPWWNTRSPV